jgi:hypothetical protein
MEIIIGLLSFVITGWLSLSFINFKSQFLERIGLSFILGSGLQSIILFVWLSIFQIAATRQNYWIFLLMLLSFLVTINTLFKREIGFVINRTKLSILTIIPWLLIFLLFLITLTYSIYEPVYMTDAISLYDFRAKVVFETHDLKRISEVENWATYPMFTSMIHLIFRFWGSGNANLYMPLMFLSFSIVFFSNLARKSNIVLASVGTFFMYSAPILLWQSKVLLNNLPYTIFLCTSIFYGLEAYENSSKSRIILIGLLLGLSAWTRLIEPFWIIVLIIILVGSIKIKKIWLGVAAILLFQTIRGVWPLFAQDASTNIGVVNQAQSVVNYVSKNPVLLDSKKSNAYIESFVFMMNSFFEATGSVPYLFIASIFLEIYFRFNPIKQPLFWTIVCLLFFVWGGTLYSRLYLDYWQTLGNALNRMCGFFIPLMIMYIFQSKLWSKIRF